MKLSLAFVALTAAADSQAPVISLNLQNYPHSGRTTNCDNTSEDPRKCVDHCGSADATKTYAPRECSTVYAGQQTWQKHGQMNTKALKPHKAESQNSFADECEVDQNDGDVTCQEPLASAYDHHDGDISTDINTIYTLFVKSDVKASPVKSNDASHQKTGIETDQRGEWVITYDVVDEAGNEAEQVQFALIMIDTVAPDFDNAPRTTVNTPCTSFTNCSASGDYNINYISSASNDTAVAVELCGIGNARDETTTWDRVNFLVSETGVAPVLTATDKYDEGLNETNSKMHFNVKKGDDSVIDS